MSISYIYIYDKYMSVMSAYFRIRVRVLNRISLLDMYVVRAYDVIKINNLKYMINKMAC